MIDEKFVKRQYGLKHIVFYIFAVPWFSQNQIYSKI